MNSNVRRWSDDDDVQKKDIDIFNYKQRLFYSRYKNKSCSACPEDQLGLI